MAKARGSASNILTVVKLTQMVKEIESGVVRGPSKKTLTPAKRAEKLQKIRKHYKA